MAHRVAILDYGTGNIASLEMALALVGAEVVLASQPATLEGVDALILPGVGHFGPASLALRASGLARAVCQRVDDGLPALGICLGFQLLTTASEEAPGAPGLALLPVACQRLRPTDTRLHKVPHLGWNTLEPSPSSSALLEGIPLEQQRFYFANAYAVAPDPNLAAVQVTYNHGRPWMGLVEKGNICGVQFHPEKSRRQGLQLLRNFLTLASDRR